MNLDQRVDSITWIKLICPESGQESVKCDLAKNEPIYHIHTKLLENKCLIRNFKKKISCFNKECHTIKTFFINSYDCEMFPLLTEGLRDYLHGWRVSTYNSFKGIASWHKNKHLTCYYTKIEMRDSTCFPTNNPMDDSFTEI